ncbi:MAG: hypothetical protein H5U40_17440, partial [Polyangiaceae bacterium]|nr:hypothetical protein [Polyangiaceae bacterium]
NSIVIDVESKIDPEQDLDLVLANAEIINDELSVNNPTLIANTLRGAIGGMVGGMLGSAIPPISIDEMLGGAALPGGMTLPLGIGLDQNSLTPITEGDERFLGVFLNFTEAPPAMGLTARADASVRVTNVTMPEDKSGFAFGSFQDGPAPTVEIAMSAAAPAGAEVEYSYRLSNSNWSPWTSSSYAVIDDPSLFLQQWHTVYVRARIKGTPYSTDFTSATARFLIDADAPQIQLVDAGGTIELFAHDVVNDVRDLEYRHREPGEEWSAWTAMDADTVEIDGATPDVEVEVRDTTGNVASSSQALRGLPAPTEGGCGGCVATGATDSSSPLALLVSALVLGAVVVR